jgi:hypothetical protein
MDKKHIYTKEELKECFEKLIDNACDIQEVQDIGSLLWDYVIRKINKTTKSINMLRDNKKSIKVKYGKDEFGLTDLLGGLVKHGKKK